MTHNHGGRFVCMPHCAHNRATADGMFMQYEKRKNSSVEIPCAPVETGDSGIHHIPAPLLSTESRAKERSYRFSPSCGFHA